MHNCSQQQSASVTFWVSLELCVRELEVAAPGPRGITVLCCIQRKLFLVYFE